jgi:DNA-binding XRE family transcriptional regulator
MNSLNILEIRKSLDMTQEEFGEHIGVDKRTIINYEQGKKIPSTKVKILESILHSGLQDSSKGKKGTFTTKKEIIASEVDSMRREILDLKDHIKTLKELIDEKNKLAEMYKNENILLKEKIDFLTKNKVSE